MENNEKEVLLKVRHAKTYFAIKKGLFKKTVGHVKAVDDISLDVYRGETLGLVGESGCGKTTLGKSILQLVPVTDGSMEYKFEDGYKDLRKLSRKELSDASGIPLRTVYAVEKGELNNLSLDRFIALISAMGAHLDVRVSDTISSKDAEMNRLIKMIATENLDADMWGIAP